MIAVCDTEYQSHPRMPASVGIILMSLNLPLVCHLFSFSLHLHPSRAFLLPPSPSLLPFPSLFLSLACIPSSANWSSLLHFIPMRLSIRNFCPHMQISNFPRVNRHMNSTGKMLSAIKKKKDREGGREEKLTPLQSVPALNHQDQLG